MTRVRPSRVCRSFVLIGGIALLACVGTLSDIAAAAPPQAGRRGGGSRRPAPPPPSGAAALTLIEPGGPGMADAFTRLPFGMMWGDLPSRLQRTLAGGGTKVTERRITPDGTREVWTVEGLLRAGPKLGSVLLTFRDQALAGVELRYGQPGWTTEQFNDAMGFLRRQLERDLGGPGELVSRGVTAVPAPVPPPPVAAASPPADAPTPPAKAAAASGPTPALTIIDPPPSPPPPAATPGETPTPAPSPAAPAAAEGGGDPTVKQTLTGYAWKRGDSMVELFYFAVEDTKTAQTFRTLSIHYRYRDPYEGKPGAPGLEAAPAPPGTETSPTKPADPNADPLPQH